MCIYSVFNFVCGARKLKIAAPCAMFSVKGGFCRDDRAAHIEDGRNGARSFARETYGPGICVNVHCRQFFGLIPPNEYHLSEAKHLAEDDKPFCMDDEARAEREDRWYRQVLSTDQQLQLLNTTFPLDINTVSPYALYVLRGLETEGQFDEQLGLSSNPDHLDWRELNPRYLDEYGLWIATSHLLPASVTDTRYHEHQTSSPFQPQFGPFKIGTHACKPADDVCKKCGKFGTKIPGRKVLYRKRDWTISTAAAASRPLGETFLPHTKLLGPPPAFKSSMSQQVKEDGTTQAALLNYLDSRELLGKLPKAQGWHGMNEVLCDEGASSAPHGSGRIDVDTFMSDD